MAHPVTAAVAVVLLLGLIVLAAVLRHDKGIRSMRLGVFFERERYEEEE